MGERERQGVTEREKDKRQIEAETDRQAKSE